MKKVLILVEGQTEETFVRDVLAPHLAVTGTHIIAKLATTKRVKSGTHFKGGITSYQKVKNDINRLLNDSSVVKVTTMLDFYGLPKTFPGKTTMPRGSCFERVAHLEEEFKRDIGNRRFLPYLSLHEFEALLFVSPEVTAKAFPGAAVAAKLQAIRDNFGSPEEIDDSPKTAPSKRILDLLPQYQKPLHGPIVTMAVGFDKIRKECQHFDQWLTKLETLKG